MGLGLEWTTGSTGLRRMARPDTRYVFLPGLHAGAALIAVGSPFLATLLILATLAPA